MSREEIFLGMAIGDGCISKRGVLQIKHSIDQKEYVLYKKELLEQHGFKVKVREYFRESYGEIRGFIEIYTSTTNFGKEMRKYLYPNGKKIIPSDLIITPIMWALIYQDDGRQNKISHYISYRDNIRTRVEKSPWVNRYTLYVDCFDGDSISVLKESLLSYGIDCGISYTNKNKLPHIHINRKESKENFKNLIAEFIHPSMMYKLDLPTCIS
jgi:hypothetical protein